MPITSTSREPNGEISGIENLFEGRVLKVEHAVESRNHSDTADYSDWRTTKCTYALVWLGTHGAPPTERHGRPCANVGFTPTKRDLEFYEQFAWVDCTNMWVFRGCAHLDPVVDADMQSGDPLMIVNFIAWEAYQASILADRADKKRKHEEAKRLAEKAAKDKADKKAAKEASLKSEAEQLLSRIPAKGTTVTVEGFTGKVFWAGVSKYRGSFNARAGVKDAKGNVQWVDANKF